MSKSILALTLLIFSAHLSASEQDHSNTSYPFHISKAAEAEKSAQKKQGPKKPTMAEYCRKHTC